MDKVDLDMEVMLPHRKPMLLVSEVLTYNAHGLTALASIHDDNPLLELGQFPGHAALEMLAQASGLLLGLRCAGEVRPGAIVSVRDMQVHVARLFPGDQMKIETNFLGGIESAAMFKGAVMQGETPVLEATLTLSQFPEGVMQ